MNHSIYSADRGTHLKVVLIALVAAIATSGFAIGTRINPQAATASAIKAGQPVMMSSVAIAVTR